MNNISYFKLQAKNLFRDWKNFKQSINETDDKAHSEYMPIYFDINKIVKQFKIMENDFTLIKAQHIIARLSGFNKWTDLISASDSKLLSAKKLLSTKIISNNSNHNSYFIGYFNLQAHRLFEDWETHQPYIDDIDGFTYYKYNPKYFDVDDIIVSFDLDEEKVTLEEAKNVIAYFAGFNEWNKLINASESELKLAKKLFDNRDIISIDDWIMFLGNAEELNNYPKYFSDPETQLALLDFYIQNYK